MEGKYSAFVQENIKEFKISGETFYFDISAHKFLFTDALSEYILAGLLSGEPLCSIVESLAGFFGKPPEEIHLDAMTFLSNCCQVENSTTEKQTELCRSLSESKDEVLVTVSLKCSNQTVIIGFTRKIDCENWCELESVRPNASTCVDDVDIVLLKKSGLSFDILCPQLEPVVASCESEAYLLLRSLAEDVAAKRLSPAIVLHAGAVVRNSNAIVFPAIGGSGKSTLVAGLCSKGYSLVHDDILPLDNKGFVHSVGQFIKLKPGSWPVLELLGTSAQVSAKIPFGSTQVRTYRFPNRIHDSPFLARWLIVPKFDENATPKATQLSSLEALQALVRADSYFKLPIDNTKMDNIIGWVENLDCWSIEYPTMQDAIDLVRAITDSQTKPAQLT